MLRSYQETLQFLYSQLPVYHQIGPAAYKNDLTNTIRLCGLLDNPEKKFKTIHVAGTNGKGSSSHMLAAILQSAGYKTGLYTSPHLKYFTERIKINGVDIRKDFVVEFVNKMLGAMEEIKPSFFELTVAMAFDYFANEQIDIAVVEVGLGGRLDSTNVIDPEISLITNIGYDHMDILGNTLPEIAREKAGIIKYKTPVVISERQEDIDEVFEEKARQTESPIFFASDTITCNWISDKIQVESNEGSFTIEPELKGLYQSKNIAGVLQTVFLLRKAGYSISDAAIKTGIEKTVTLTGLKGRWQKIQERPLVICDTAHNAEGLKEIIRQIQQTPHQKLRWVFGMVKDKSPDRVLEILPKLGEYYFCQANIPRAMDANELRERAAAKGLEGCAVRDVNDALNLAKEESSHDDLILVGGSTFVVAEVKDL